MHKKYILVNKTKHESGYKSSELRISFVTHDQQGTLTYIYTNKVSQEINIR